MPLEAFRNTFAGSPLDRASDRRRDTAWLAARLADPTSYALAFWKGSPLVAGGGIVADLGWADAPKHAGGDEAPRLTRLEPGLASELGSEGERLLFLGLDPEGVAVFAVDVEGAADPSAGVLQGRGAFQGLRELAAVMAPAESAMAAGARAMFEWRRKMRFCPVCGGPLGASEGGWKRVCAACGTEHFPRTDPVVIMLPVRGERCLLGRQASWPPGRFSALAGFMEPGETIEEACSREIGEECGLDTLSVRYHSSQPWPFPSNLMIGLIAEVAEGEARPDQTELEAVRWVSREEARALLRGGGEIGLPPPLAIAHQLIAAWVLAPDSA